MPIKLQMKKTDGYNHKQKTIKNKYFVNIIRVIGMAVQNMMNYQIQPLLKIVLGVQGTVVGLIKSQKNISK